MSSVTYESAMVSLRSMFGGLDDELITEVLKANQGHLERTVEQLLLLTGGATAETLGVPIQSSSSSSSSSHQPQRKHSAAAAAAAAPDTTPSVGGSNLPDDFLRTPSYFANRYNSHQRRGSSSGQSQIDQDAILAQMLQDELFMQDIREHPEFYEQYDQQQQQPQQVHAHAPTSGTALYQPPVHTASTTPPSSSSSAVPFPAQSNRGDFTGYGSAAAHPNQHTFRERWNSLTAAARERLLKVANRLKADHPTNGQTATPPKQYNIQGTELSSGLLSDTDSEAATEKDVAPIAVSDIPLQSSVQVADGVYSNEDEEADVGTGSGYVPPSMAGSINFTGKKTWGKQKNEEEDSHTA